MPSKVINTMNQVIRAEVTAAEINAVNRPFVAFSLARLQGQRGLIHGLVWSVGVFTLADRPACTVTLQLQKGLIVSPTTGFPAEEIPAQMMFQISHDLDVSMPTPWFPARPLPLPPGDSYALFMTIAPRVAFAGGALMLMTVFGEFEPVAVETEGMVL